MEHRTLLIGGRNIRVCLTAPLSADGDVLTDDFGIRWHGRADDGTEQPLALVADPAIGVHIEVGAGAGEDVDSEFGAATPVAPTDVSAAKAKLRERRKRQK